MRTFAILVANRVDKLIDLPNVEALAHIPGAQNAWIDVTTLRPRPSVGDTYNPAANTFASPAPVVRPLAEIKEEALARIVAECGAWIRNFVTEMTGIDSIYRLKSEEVDRYDAALNRLETPVATDYPYLHAEAVNTNRSLLTVYSVVKSKRNLWTQLGAAIEGTRQGAEQRVADATTAVQVAAIFPITWPMP